MARYQNAEIRKSGQTIRVNVIVDIDGYVPITGPSAASYVWNGVLHPPNNTGLTLADVYQLMLPDFAPARIRITSEANPIDGTVSFEGLGEIPLHKTGRQVTVK